MRYRIIFSAFLNWFLFLGVESAFSQLGLPGGLPSSPKYSNNDTLHLGEGQNFELWGADSVPVTGGFSVGEDSTGFFYLSLKPSDTSRHHLNLSGAGICVKITDNVQIDSIEIMPGVFVNEGITLPHIEVDPGVHDDTLEVGYIIKFFNIRGGGAWDVWLTYNPPVTGTENAGFENSLRIGKIHYTLLDQTPGDSASIQLLDYYYHDDGVNSWTFDVNNTTVNDAGITHFRGKGQVAGYDSTFMRTAYFSNASLLALPVELLFFNAEVQGQKVHTSWATSNEVDNDYFIVQRSKDVENFEDVSDKIQGKGNSNERNDYSYDDDPTESGIYYYRLKQIDFDGNEEFSNIVPVNFILDGDAQDLLGQPLKIVALNMINGQLYVIYNINKTEQVTFRIFDVYGNLKNKEYDNPAVGGNAKSMRFGNPSGIYIITATSGNDYDNRKFSIVE